MNWKLPVYIFASLATNGLILASLSTTFWVQKEEKHNVYHYGIFEGCVNDKCVRLKTYGDGYDWSARVKAMTIISIIFGIVSSVLACVRICLKKKIKAFISPILALISASILISGIGVYGNHHSYVTGSDHTKVEDLKYGWSFILACLACAFSILNVVFGFCSDCTDVFGKSEEDFQAKRLDEVVS